MQFNSLLPWMEIFVCLVPFLLNIRRPHIILLIRVVPSLTLNSTSFSFIEEESEQQASSESAEEQEASEAQADPEQPVPVEGLTEEQALQLLRAIGQNTQTLQERLQQNMDEGVPSDAPEKDW